MAETFIELGWVSIQHVMAQQLKQLLPGMVWVNVLPEADSYLTNNSYGIVILEPFSVPISENGCAGSVKRATVTLHIYSRKDCGEPGIMAALTQVVIDFFLNSLPGEYPKMWIDGVVFLSSSSLPQFSRSYRSRALSLAVDYKDK